MESILKKVKIIAVVLVIVLLSAIAFGGIYLKQNGLWSNIIPELKYGMELNGYRQLTFTLNDEEETKDVYVDSEGNYAGDVKSDDSTTSTTDVDLTTATTDESATEQTAEGTVTTDETEATEETVTDDPLANYTVENKTIKNNPDEEINIDNFNKVKNILQSRLEAINEYEYNIRVDQATGGIVLEVPDNDDTVYYEKMYTVSPGKFEVIDYQNGLVLLDNSNIKSATCTYTSSSGYQAYLILTLDKEGQEILKNMSTTYVATTDDAGTTTTNYVEVTFDGDTLCQTYFGEELDEGVMNIPVGNATTDTETFESSYETAQRLAFLLNSGELPLEYELVSDQYVLPTITETTRHIAITVFAAVVFVVSIVMIVMFKAKGLKYSLYNVGYLATLVLLFRYTNVSITFNSVIAFVCMEAFNLFYFFVLGNMIKSGIEPKEAYKKALAKVYLAAIPVILVGLFCVFMPGLTISSIGMVIFWGLMMNLIETGIIRLMDIV